MGKKQGKRPPKGLTSPQTTTKQPDNRHSEYECQYQKALCEAVSQNQILRDRVIQLESLLVAAQLQQEQLKRQIISLKSQTKPKSKKINKQEKIKRIKKQNRKK